MILEEKFREWLTEKRSELIRSSVSPASLIYSHVTLGRIQMIGEIQELLGFNNEVLSNEKDN